MYQYINRKTGASFTSDRMCAGEDWQMVVIPASPRLESEVQEEEKPKRTAKRTAGKK